MAEIRKTGENVPVPADCQNGSGYDAPDLSLSHLSRHLCCSTICYTCVGVTLCLGARALQLLTSSSLSFAALSSPFRHHHHHHSVSVALSHCHFSVPVTRTLTWLAPRAAVALFVQITVNVTGNEQSAVIQPTSIQNPKVTSSG